ncbi:MAG TPA: hypothetical protein ENK68_03805 [Epsilonproteobacteria bacterium]|nr:hypothetical protein [Campylobacterota bacterium]
MKLLSINKDITHDKLDITFITESELASCHTLKTYNFIIINGGDGTIRRVIKTLHTIEHNAKFILNPTGSFNVVAKLHKVPKLNVVLDALSKGTTLPSKKHIYYSLNKEIFLYSAGNMGDLQHILLSETLRFGILKHGIAKYALALLFLFPIHLVMTPFMLLSSKKFFIFTPASFIGKFGNLYGKVNQEIHIDLENRYNLIELDGDVILMKKAQLEIKPAGNIEVIVR